MVICRAGRTPGVRIRAADTSALIDRGAGAPACCDRYI